LLLWRGDQIGAVDVNDKQTLSGVSILVVVEGRSDLRGPHCAKRVLPGFNPCCCGGAIRSKTSDRSGRDIARFQSLLLWRGDQIKTEKLRSVALLRGFNPCCCGGAIRSISAPFVMCRTSKVSILVVVEGRSDRYFQMVLAARCPGVSILVVVEGRSDPEKLLGTCRSRAHVSILVVVEGRSDRRRSW